MTVNQTTAQARAAAATRWACALLGSACLLLAGCGESAQEKAQRAETKRVHCLDHFCEGDVRPTYDVMNEEALKLNGQWYVGPKEYFSSSFNGAAFEWWDHKPVSPKTPRSPEAQALAVAGNSGEFSIAILLRSRSIPPEPRGYKLIELAQANDWIASRKLIRPGLEAITMKHVAGPDGYFIDHVTYYVATDLKDQNGLPPVGVCAHTRSDGGGGTGFMWQPGIWAGANMNQKHCADWPEIYQEIVRVLQLLQKV